MTMPPRLLTVILNWRTPDMTLRAAAAALREMEGIAGELVIVDNDSGDGSFETMQDALTASGWDRVRVLQAGRNGGFGAGNNHGIRAGLSDGSRPDFVYILNSDAFPDPGSIAHLMDFLTAHPQAGFAGSHVRGEDDAPHCTAFRFPSIASEFEGAVRTGVVSRLLSNAIVPLPIPTEATRVEWVAGASLLARMECLDDIGLFDEAYFLYFEETDLALRAARAGWQTWYVPDSRVVHIGSVSTGMKSWARMPEYWFDSRRRYFTRNHGRAYAALATGALALGATLWRLRCAIQRRDLRDPPHFLRDLLIHSLRGGGAPRAKRAALPSRTL